jgi:hypothetical protein
MDELLTENQREVKILVLTDKFPISGQFTEIFGRMEESHMNGYCDSCRRM